MTILSLCISLDYGFERGIDGMYHKFSAKANENTAMNQRYYYNYGRRKLTPSFETVSHAERHVFPLNIFKDLVLQYLDDDHVPVPVRIGAPYDAQFTGKRTLEDYHRAPNVLRVDGSQVPDRYRVR